MKWIILGLAILSVSFASEPNSLPKKYVPLDGLSIGKEGIFVFSDDAWFEVPSIYHDDQGFYVRTHLWNCPSCSHSNYDVVKRCEDCGFYKR
jgi:hypothetical protein